MIRAVLTLGASLFAVVALPVHSVLTFAVSTDLLTALSPTP